MPVSPFDHPVLSGLFGDRDAEHAFSFDVEMAAMLAFEQALADAEAREGVIPEASAKMIAAAVAKFEPDVPALRAGAARDGVIVPELVRQLRAAVGDPHGADLHFGVTSQDVLDTALALRLIPLLDAFALRLDALIVALDALLARDGHIAVMAHTRMQQAIMVTAARKIESWRGPLLRHRTRLDAVRADIALLHLGGAAGTLDKLGDKGPIIAAHMAETLGLQAIDHPRHSERDGEAALAGWLSLVNGSLGKMGQDIVLGAQNEIGEIKLATGGGSSAMPHKVNPVGAEMLVTLARFNAGLLATMHQGLVHENERSGAAWTLEWMVLPQMCAVTGAALRLAHDLVATISFTETGGGARR